MAKSKKIALEEMRRNNDYVVLNNPLASPKFVRLLGKGHEVVVNDIYTPKIFYEIASQLKPDHLVDVDRNQSIPLEISIKSFLSSIGANEKNFKHFIDSVEVMQSSLLTWKEGDDIITTAIVSKTIHNTNTGKVQLFVDCDIARRILELKEEGNFSFLKSNVFKLQNAQAIKLYPFFKSWVNFGSYSVELDRFKIQFGYDTPGYKYWSNLETKVIKPAIDEINLKTDLQIAYIPNGSSMVSKKPRIKGVTFRINKKKIVELEEGTEVPEAPTEIVDAGLQELYDLFTKIKVVEIPLESTTKSMLSGLVQELGHQPVKDGLLGILDSKAKPKTIAFFTKENLLKYPNYEAMRETVASEKKAAAQHKNDQLRKKQLVKEITEAYNKAKEDYCIKSYEGLSEDGRQSHLQTLWDQTELKSVYFKQGKFTEPNTFAMIEIGSKVALNKEYDVKGHMQKFALKNFNQEISFTETGEMVIK